MTINKSGKFFLWRIFQIISIKMTHDLFVHSHFSKTITAFQIYYIFKDIFQKNLFVSFWYYQWLFILIQHYRHGSTDCIKFQGYEQGDNITLSIVRISNNTNYLCRYKTRWICWDISTDHIWNLRLNQFEEINCSLHISQHLYWNNIPWQVIYGLEFEWILK